MHSKYLLHELFSPPWKYKMLNYSQLRVIFDQGDNEFLKVWKVLSEFWLLSAENCCTHPVSPAYLDGLCISCKSINACFWKDLCILQKQICFGKKMAVCKEAYTGAFYFWGIVLTWHSVIMPKRNRICGIGIFLTCFLQFEFCQFFFLLDFTVMWLLVSIRVEISSAIAKTNVRT